MNFLMTMDYSPWVERENWPFLKVAISPKPERSHPPKLVYMYVTSTPTCMIFLSHSKQLNFLMTMEYMAVFEISNISETGEVTPTKIGVYVCYINTYLHDFFEPILSN